MIINLFLIYLGINDNNIILYITSRSVNYVFSPNETQLCPEEEYSATVFETNSKISSDKNFLTDCTNYTIHFLKINSVNSTLVTKQFQTLGSSKCVIFLFVTQI